MSDPLRKLHNRMVEAYQGRPSELERRSIEDLREEFRYSTGGKPRRDTVHAVKVSVLSYLGLEEGRRRRE
jgi:hypothetical protein